MGYTHNKGFDALDSGFAVGAVGSEVQIIDATGNITLPTSKALTITTGAFVKGSRFQVTYPQVAAADVAKTFFIAPCACKVVEARERHVTVAGQACTLQIEKLTSGTAPGSGVSTLAAAFDLTSTANTPVTKSAVSTADGTLAAGDALALKVASGSATSYALGTITVTMQVV